ncbi:hypothetical protein PInf_004777 [Phytophthora infestans]|nr:hypothetical protein PInf_004777 [Phytophthora infestans]
MTNKGKPGETASMIETLSARYGDDAVAKALVSAGRREDSSLELMALAQQLQSQQLYAWLDSDKSVGDVFKLLKLKNDGYEALTSRKMLVLDDYIAKFNHHYPEHQTSLLEALTKGFGGESNLVSLLNTAKQDTRTMVKARGLEAGMLKQWQDESLEPANVMKLLHLDQSVTSVLTNINLRTFLKYLKKFNENNPTKQETLVGVMASIYGEANVAKAIVSALRAGDTNGVAAKLELQQFKGWMARHLSGEDVFRLLKIRNDDFFRHSRNLPTLDNYIQFINREKGADETLIGVLTRGFGESRLAELLMGAKSNPLLENTAIKLQNAQFSEWSGKHLAPAKFFTDIFKVEEAKASATQKEVVKGFAAYANNHSA